MVERDNNSKELAASHLGVGLVTHMFWRIREHRNSKNIQQNSDSRTKLKGKNVIKGNVY